MSTTTLMDRPTVRRDDPAAEGDRAAPQSHLDAMRAELADSIARVTEERERVRRMRDGISPLERRFNTEGHRLWLQLDDWLNGLDAAITDAPDLDGAVTATAKPRGQCR